MLRIGALCISLVIAKHGIALLSPPWRGEDIEILLSCCKLLLKSCYLSILCPMTKYHLG